MDWKLESQRWLDSQVVPEDLKQELRQYEPELVKDAFYKRIEFGTAGMRGLMGPGTNRINSVTIKGATIAFGQYLLARFPDDARQRGVAIAHDNRHKSRTYNDDIASVLSRMGFHVYIFDELRPTPELSFAVRHLHAIGGIVITASHNPKEYNGFKVYDENGCQLTPEKIEPLLKIIEGQTDLLNLEITPDNSVGEITLLDNEIDRIYLKLIEDIALYPDLTKRDFKIVYSPQHGSAYRLGVELLRQCGYELYPVESQSFPDPDFINTKSPNPETSEAYEAAIELAQKIKAHLIVVTDPDADRVGIAYRDRRGHYIRLTGNQSGALLLDYILRERSNLGLLADNGVVYDTIVTSPLGRKIAEYYGCRSESFLTGFKFIGDRIDFYEKSGGPHFEFGYEESYGCLIAPFARDKDGLQALLMYAEMTLFYHRNRYDLGQRLHILHKRHGFHDDRQYSIALDGIEGAKKLTFLMNKLRETPFKTIGKFRVKRFDDYLAQQTIEGKDIRPIELPPSDVLRFTLEDDSSIIIRPSGTEPKCKFYYSVAGASLAAINHKIERLHAAFCATYEIIN